MSVTNTKRHTQRQRVREIYSLLRAGFVLYSKILDNISVKLERHFNSDVFSGPIGDFKLQAQTSIALATQACPVPAVAAAPQAARPERTNLTPAQFNAAVGDIEKLMDFFFSALRAQPSSYSGLQRRYLPQTSSGVAATSLFFPTAPISELDSIDFTDQFITTRESSKIKDAIVAYNTATSKTRAALRALLVTWTRSGREPFQLIHFHLRAPMMPALSGKRVAALPNSFALQLCPPSDIFETLSGHHATEGDKIRIQSIATSPDPYHGARNSWEYVLAMQFYAEIVTLELMRKHSQQEDWQRASFSTRQLVDGIVLKSADFVLKACESDGATILSATNPALFASETRRYAHLLVQRVHANDFFKYGAVQSLKLVADAAKAIARNKKLDWSRLPVEPLASLRMSYVHGVQAFQRITRALPVALQNAAATYSRALCVAAHPVVLLDRGPGSGDGWKRDGIDPIVLTDDELSAPYEERTFNENELAALRARFESLRIGFDDRGLAGITSRIADVALDAAGISRLEPGRFFVPYTYGDHLPPLSVAGTPAHMFASVPVVVSALLKATDSLIVALAPSQRPSIVQLPPSSLEVVPSFTGCRSTSTLYALANPNEIVFDGATIRFLGSHVQGAKPPLEPPAPPNPDSTPKEVASAATLNGFTDSLSDAYSCIAWNAERMLQSVVLAACARKKEVGLRVPPAGVEAFPDSALRRLSEQRDLLTIELAFQVRLWIRSIRVPLKRFAATVNQRLVGELEDARGSLAVGLTGKAVADSLADYTVSPARKPAATGVVLPPPREDLTPQQIFLDLEGFDSDSTLVYHALRTDGGNIIDYALQYIDSIPTTDFRQFVWELGDAENIKNWVFRYDRFGLGRIVEPETYEFEVTNGGQSVDGTLPDLSDAVKRQLVADELRFTTTDVIRSEGPYRMIKSITAQLRELDRKIGQAQEQMVAQNIHGRAFRERFAASAVLAEALARGLLGDAACPTIKTFTASAEDETVNGLDGEEYDNLTTRMQALKSAFGVLPQNSALKLGEVCAIMFSVLSE